MQISSWVEIERDLKLGVFLITVAAQSLVGDRSKAAMTFGTAALGKSLSDQPAAAQADELEDIQGFDVSGTHLYAIAKILYDFVQDRTPLDQLEVGDLQADTINLMTYFLSAIPRDKYATQLGVHAHRFTEHSDRGGEFPLPSLHLAASAKANLVEFLQGFPGELEHGIGFAPYEIAELAGMNIASVRNFVGPGGSKPIRSMPSKDRNGVYGQPLDTLQWLAGRRNFNPGPLSSEWLNKVADRIETAEHAGAMIGIYAWTNRITTEMLAERSRLPVEVIAGWTRGELTTTEDAAAIAEAAGVDPEFYTDLVARCGGVTARI